MTLWVRHLNDHLALALRENLDFHQTLVLDVDGQYGSARAGNDD